MNNDGGSAFPQTETEYGADFTRSLSTGGMTLRDYFAAAALQGMLSDSEFDVGCSATAELAYGYADAMLKARK